MSSKPISAKKVTGLHCVIESKQISFHTVLLCIPHLAVHYRAHKYIIEAQTMAEEGWMSVVRADKNDKALH